MLPIQFLGQNTHFAISLFAALVFFSGFWLYLDAWTSSREKKALITCAGFLLVSLSFVATSTTIEQSVLGNSLLGNINEILGIVLRTAGYATIIIAQLIDPLQKKPKVIGLNEEDFTESGSPTTKSASAVGFTSSANLSHLLLPAGAAAVAWLYWRRATVGLERHLRLVAIGFAFLTIYELLSLAKLWQGSDNPQIASLVASFGLVWSLEQLFLLIGAAILGVWIWHYLTLRFLSQLFMVFTSATLAIFLLTTVTFTFLLTQDVQNQSLNNLQTATNVLKYAVNGKQSETLAKASAVAQNPGVVAATVARDTKALAALTSNTLRDQKLTSIIVTNSNGQVLLRAEDQERYGDSLSSNTLVRRALIGESKSSISTRNGVLAPLIYIDSAVPIRDAGGTIIGTVITGVVIDNAFVDGLKQSTGLDSAIYAGNVRSATTFVAPDGVSRLVGSKEANADIQKKVLKSGQTYKGIVSMQNSQYLGVYEPLKDADNSVIGMLFIGQPQTSVLKTAGHSIQLTFIVTAILIILAIAPAYLVAKYLHDQLH